MANEWSVLIEIHDRAALDRAEACSPMIGVNNRDLA